MIIATRIPKIPRAIVINAFVIICICGPMLVGTAECFDLAILRDVDLLRDATRLNTRPVVKSGAGGAIEAVDQGMVT
jgi:hypothetical protein